MADLLSDFHNLQYYIAAAATEPVDQDDYYTEGWAALRQCSLDGQQILNVAADTRVPESTGGEDEQAKAELKQYVASGLCYEIMMLMVLLGFFLMLTPDVTRRKRSGCARARPNAG